MASIAQGLVAGQLATGLNALAPFIAALQGIATNGGQISGLALTVLIGNGGTASITGPAFASPAPLSVQDSAALATQLANMMIALQGEWTNQLTAL